MRIALMLDPYPNVTWSLARQLGVTDAVTKLPQFQSMTDESKPWHFLPLLHLKKRFEDAGLHLSVLEGDQFPMNRIKLGLPGRDEDIDRFCLLLKNMGKVGISTLCYNFMAQFGWLRTSITTRTRGGALTSSFDYDLVKNAPLTEAGMVNEDRLWSNLIYFLKAVIPVAEESGVRMAIHPDDPPISPIGGVSRILTSVAAFRRVLESVPSECNGITLCQANFVAMGANLSETIRYFGNQRKIFFVHFRDIKGDARNFVETFHDDGQTNMVEAIKCYREIGFHGPIRPDHVPTMEGEENDTPGYKVLGRLFAVGYMRGLLEAVDHYRLFVNHEH